MSAGGRPWLLWFLAIIGALTSVRADSQDLAAGKTPAQLFAGGCSPCHKSPQGLPKSDTRSTAGFLRQHYTSNPGMADALAAYLAASGGAATRDRVHPAASTGAPEHAALPAPALGGRMHGPHPAAGEGASSDANAPAQVEPGSGKRRPNRADDGRKPRLTVHGIEEPTKPPGHHAFAPTTHEPSPIPEEHASPPAPATSMPKQHDDAGQDETSAAKDGLDRPAQQQPAATAEPSKPAEHAAEPSKPAEHAATGSVSAAPTDETSSPSASTSSKPDEAANNKTAKSDAAEEEKTATRARAETPMAGRGRRAARSTARRAAPITSRPSDGAD